MLKGGEGYEAQTSQQIKGGNGFFWCGAYMPLLFVRKAHADYTGAFTDCGRNLASPMLRRKTKVRYI